MSCFGGRMQEYDRVSLDRFDGKNLQSTVYFLSHLHEDHTAGLGEKIFLKRLKSNKDIVLYCSEVTQVLLVASKKYHRLKPYIRGLSINTPTTINIPDPLYEEVEKITVTLLPAFHCPGSVMFLIEGKEGTVLYTGDFRWEHFNIEQMHHLRSGERYMYCSNPGQRCRIFHMRVASGYPLKPEITLKGASYKNLTLVAGVDGNIRLKDDCFGSTEAVPSVKKIKSLYIDTTFCSLENLYIPSRQQCIDAVCQLVHEWTSLSPKHVVKIYLRAQYGHEPLLNAVASRLNKKVHVDEHKVSVYNRIQEFHGNFTTEGISTQIHACSKDCMIDVDGEEMLCREAHDADKVLAILPTTMYFTQFQHLTLDKIVIKINSNFFRACYSFHSSYTEVKDLLSYLKPERVFPNVKTPADSTLAVTQHRLNTMLKECLESGAGEVTEEEVKELGTLKTRSGRQVKKRKGRESISDAESLDFGSPVKVARFSLSSSLETGEPAPTDSPSAGTRKGRGRGRGKGIAETASQPAIGTRRSTRRSAATPTPELKTPKKSKKSERSPTPDLFLTPASDTSDQHSSFGGSERSDSELSLFSSQKSMDLAASGEAANSWTAGSFLAAVTSSSEDDTATGRAILFDDEEQTDEQFEDHSQFSDTEEEEEGIEQVTSETPSDKHSEREDDDSLSPKDIVQSKEITKSPVKRGKRGKNGKGSVKSTFKGLDSDKKSDLETLTVSKPENNEFEVSDSAGNEADSSSMQLDSKVKESETEKLESETGIVSDKADEVVESVNESTAAQRGENSSQETLDPESYMEIDSWSADIADEEGKNDKLPICLETQLNKAEEYTSKSSEPKSNDDTEEKENVTKDGDKICDGKVDNITETSEDLHLHLSDTTNDDEENRDKSKMCDNKNDEILIIDSDSSDEVDGGEKDIGAHINTKVDENDRTEAESHLNKSIVNVDVTIVDSDSNDVRNKDLDDDKHTNSITPENAKSKDNNTESESNINPEYHSSEQADRDQQIPEENRSLEFDGVGEKLSKEETDVTELVAIKELGQCISEKEHIHTSEEKICNQTNGSVKVIGEVQNGKDADTEQVCSEGSSKLEVDSQDTIEMRIGETKVEEEDPNENKVVNDDEDDDVIEIVDLTGDDMTAQLENLDTLKPGKKPIKISLLTKTESIMKVKRTVRDKSNEAKSGINVDTDDSESDSDNINEISSSPEWLSAKKASGHKHQSATGKRKKTVGSKIQKLRRRDELKDNKPYDSEPDIETSIEISRKEIDERAEVRRQAVGFMCETDSESDTDESSDPGSPTADILYDDYVELSSDSDNEDGIGGKRKGGKAFGRKSKHFKGSGNGSVNGNSGSTTQGWLNSRKHTNQSESVVQDAVIDEVDKCDSQSNNFTEISNFEAPKEPLAGYPDLPNAKGDEFRETRIMEEEESVLESDNSSLTTTKDTDHAALPSGSFDMDIHQQAKKENQLTEKNTCENSDQFNHPNTDTDSNIGKDNEVLEQTDVTGDSSAIRKNAHISTSGPLFKNTVLQTEKESDISEKNTIKNNDQGSQPNAASTNQSDEAGDQDNVLKQVTTVRTVEESQVTTGRTVEKSQVEQRTDVSDMQEPTGLLVEKPTLKTGKNSNEICNSEGNDLASNKNCLQTGKKNDSTEKEKIETVVDTPKLVRADTVSESITENPTLLLDAPEIASDQSEKLLVQKSEKLEDKLEAEKHVDTELRRETHKPFTTEKVVESTSISTTEKSGNINDGNRKLLEKKKVDDWRKLPPSNVSRISNIINFTSEPAPPGTEDLPCLVQEPNKISSVISRSRPVKTFQHKASAPVTPPSSTAVHKPLYNLLVAGGTPSDVPHPGIGPPFVPYQYPSSVPPAPFPNYPPPGWGQYPYGPPPGAPFPPPSPSTTFTQPPPNVPYSPVVSDPTINQLTAAVSSSAAQFPTNPVFSPSVTVAPAVPSAHNSVINSNFANTKTQPSQSNWSTTELTQTKSCVTTAKPKKLAPWQQKKADIFERGPSCVAKKEIKSKVTVNIEKQSSQQNRQGTQTWKPPASDGKSENQGNYVDNLSRLSQRGVQQKPESMDLASIKANISALTGLSVKSSVNTAANVPADLDKNQSKVEELPALVERLKKLQEMQAILEAVNSPQSTYGNNNKGAADEPVSQYSHSQHAESKGPIKDENYDRREIQRDRFSRDDEYDSGQRRRSYEYEGRERDIDGRYTGRSRDYYEFDRRERTHDDYDRRERSHDDYDRRERGVGAYRKVERDVVNVRRDREYVDYGARERDIDYERWERDYIAYRETDRDYADYGRRDRDLDHGRREREFERRYREEEDYRRWVEERRRMESYREDRRVSPSRYPGHTDQRYEDTYYDRRPPPRHREPEYEERTERSQREMHNRGRQDSYESYGDYPPPRPQAVVDRPGPHSSYDDQQQRYQDVQPEFTVQLNSYGENERNAYGTQMSTHQEVVPESTSVQASYTSHRNVHSFKKKPIMARVLSRSGQLLSVQSGWQSAQQTSTTTTTDAREEQTDVPVFLTGMKYYSTPTDN